MKIKANCLMDRLKTDLARTDRGELMQDGAPVPGSNIVDPGGGGTAIPKRWGV